MKASRKTAGVENGTLADEAYLAIREWILRGDLALGEPVSSRRLARQLGMSHLPVAQALRRLESEGFLESRPRAGTRVRVPTEKDIMERYEVREALETQSARLFAKRASEAQRRKLSRMAEVLDRMFERAASGELGAEFFFEVHRFHFELHLAIAEGANCQALQELIERNQILTFNWFYDVAAHLEELPAGFHKQLAESLVGGDEAAADEAMRAHVRNGRQDRVKRIEQRSQPGSRSGAWRSSAPAD
ncbi:MAG: GntR family transcriptional regulator [Acidobacteria bacterium]|nr:GntR family transcriptional regulator [Acidobacteriota bacterium]